MAPPFATDLGRAARAVPRGAVALPRTILALPKAIVSAPSKRTRRRIALALLLIAALTAAYMLWFRNSSLVAVEDVKVTGLEHASDQVAAALTAEAEKMTTLNLDVARLERAAESYPTVHSISADPSFPHGLEIEVTERIPVATIGAEEGLAVAGDGTVLSGLAADELKLPALAVENAPAEGRLDGGALAQAELLGAAPGPLLATVKSTAVDRKKGLLAVLAGGIELRFGDLANAEAKWAAAAAILADPKLDTLSYIDLRVPGRPAVGGAPLPEPDPEEEAAAEPAPVVPADPAAAPVDPAAVAPVDPAAAPPATDPAAAPAPVAPAPTDPATGVAGAATAP